MSVLPLQRLQALRQWMAEQPTPLEAYWIPSSDEFGNEYVPEHLNRREYLTGFTGSAGDALVTQDEAWLWVDGRYHEQVDAEVDSRCWSISKQGKPKQTTFSELLERLAQAQHDKNRSLTVGFPGGCVSQAALKRQQAALKAPFKDLIQWIPTATHGVDSGWGDRPNFASQPAYTVVDSTAGQSVAEKLAALGKAMAAKGVTHLPLTTVDAVAWVFNLRGNDIPHIPVCLAFGLIERNGETLTATVFTDAPLPNTTGWPDTITVQPLDAFESNFLRSLQLTHSKGALRAWGDGKHTSAGLMAVLQQADVTIEDTASPVYGFKAIKNLAEQRGMKLAHQKASVALVTVWHRLETAMAAGEIISEKQASDWVSEAYAADPAFVSLSFPSIVGFGANAAIVHYSNPSPNRFLQPGEWVLIDSGAQYHCSPDQDPEGTGWMGTTDTTRTFVFGAKPTPEQQQAYTAVLQAHAAMARQRFPKGTTGGQLDVLVRAPLWQQGLDFLHGTGHGVGCFLSVHEGPNGIGKGYTIALELGMITSIEPGYYRGGWGGIRLENLALTVATDATLDPGGEALYAFEPLQQLPFDPALIAWEQLPEAEGAWVRQYHHVSLQALKEVLDPALCEWLMQKVQ
ncbi:MAG: M24 family metallopeptidase [Vampirovibrionales bacterium]|nr:M24 family metallopeptidase [Vampirovibrionales bacterium]